MLGEFILRNADLVDINRILSHWSCEADARWHWDKHHLLIDQMHNTGTYTAWSHDLFLALPLQGTQNKLQQAYSWSLYTYLFSLVDQRRAIKIMSAAGHGASAFLHTPEYLPGCSISNQEFEVAVKLRIGATVYANLPSLCACGHAIDPTGDHLLKCKRGNEWDMRHTSINQVMASNWTPPVRISTGLLLLLDINLPCKDGFNCH